MRNKFDLSNKVLSLVFLSVLLFIVLNVADLYTVFLFILCLLLFLLPGFLLLPSFLGNHFGNGAERFLWGSILGYSLSSLVILAAGYIKIWEPLPLVCILLVLSAAAYFVSFKRQAVFAGNVDIHGWEGVDYRILIFFSVLALVSVLFPFLNVARTTPKGLAFPSLFAHDFILRMSYSASISHGIPPAYLNYSGLKLQTYWIYYVFPGFVHMAAGHKLSLQSILILTEVFQILIFLGAIFSLLRIFVNNKKALALTMFLLTCAYSYYGYFALLKTSLAQMSAKHSAFLASTGVFEHFSLLSHSYFRDFLVEPQALFAVCLILLILRVITFNPEYLGDKKFSLLAGGLSGLAFGTDASIGIICICWYMLMFAADLKNWRKRLVSFFVFCAAVAGMSVCYSLIGMYSYNQGSSGMQLKPYLQIILTAPAYFLLESGSMAIFAFLCFIVSKTYCVKRELFPLFILGLFSLFFILFLRHSCEMNLGLRKGIKTLQIPLLVLSGIFLENVYLRLKNRRLLKNAITCLMALGLLTLFVDIYSASNLKDESNTTFINPTDYAACQWIKHNTPLGATVQCEPEYPGVYEYSLISCFAERAMVVGESKLGKTLHVPNGYEFSESRKRDIRKMFSTTDLSVSLDLIKKYGISYVYVGSLENKLYPEGVTKFRQNDHLFKNVYSNQEVTVYQFEP